MPRWLRFPTANAATVAYVLALAAAAVVIGIGWFGWQRYERIRAAEHQAEFIRVADQSARSLLESTAVFRNALLGLRATFLSSRDTEPAEFIRYIEALDLRRNLRGLRAFAFNRDLDGAELEPYLARIRAGLAPLNPVYATVRIEPPGQRAHYHVVELIEPAAGNDRSLGFDLWHDAARRETIERARRDGFAATPPIHLRQEPASLAILMLAPVPDPDGREGPLARHSVAASFRARDLIDNAIAPAFRQRFFLRITDIGPADAPPNEARELFRDTLPPGADDPFAGNRTVTYDEQFGGRRWRLEFAPRDGRGPAAMPGYAAAGVVVLAGVALLVAAVVLLAMQRVQRAASTRARAELASDSELGLDSEGIVVEADESVGRLTGRARSHWEGQPLWAGVQPDDADRVREAIRRAADGDRRTTVEFRVADEDGRDRWFAARLGNHLGAPLIRRILVQVSDIDARKAAEAEVTRMAFYDPLTDLPNRRLLEERARQVLSSARRNDQRAGVLVIDLDGFKAVNDGAGHAVGDEALRIVADRLVAAVRESDTVARLGGDEFVVLLSEPSGDQEVKAAAERIAEAIRRPVDLAGVSWRLDASIGAALFPDCNQDFGLLLSAADVAMYRSKRAGGGVLTIAGAIPADA